MENFFKAKIYTNNFLEAAVVIDKSQVETINALRYGLISVPCYFLVMHEYVCRARVDLKFAN